MTLAGVVEILDGGKISALGCVNISGGSLVLKSSFSGVFINSSCLNGLFSNIMISQTNACAPKIIYSVQSVFLHLDSCDPMPSTTNFIPIGCVCAVVGLAIIVSVVYWIRKRRIQKERSYKLVAVHHPI